MSEMEDGIIVLDEVSLMRRRIGSLLQGYNVHVFEATYDVELYNMLADDNYDIRLILMDLGFDINKGFEILSKIKEKKPYIPVYIITSNNKRQTFIRGMAEGASDYILKPFDDDMLLEKILAVLKTKKEFAAENININFNIHNYLRAELKKASKGKYEITVLMCTLFEKGNEVNNIIENKYLRVIELFYKNIKKNLWDTDIFERYGSQTFIGVFPYCTAANVDIIQKKTMHYFESIVEDNKELAVLQMAIATITYPKEDLEVKNLLLTLGMQMNKKIEEIKHEVIEPVNQEENMKLVKSL